MDNSNVSQQLQKPGIADLAAAYVAATGEIENVVKNASNPHFGSNYADLGAVLDTAKPIFAKHGLALLQCPAMIEGDKITILGILIHTSGQSIQIPTQLPIGQKMTAQAVGSCITYGRRYQWAAVAGMAQVDDDGNHASDSKPRGKREAPGATSSSSGDSYAAQVEGLIARIETTETLADVEALKSEVAEFGDQKVADVFVARKKKLKAAK